MDGSFWTLTSKQAFVSKNVFFKKGYFGYKLVQKLQNFRQIFRWRTNKGPLVYVLRKVQTKIESLTVLSMVKYSVLLNRSLHKFKLSSIFLKNSCHDAACPSFSNQFSLMMFRGNLHYAFIKSSYHLLCKPNLKFRS